MSWFRVGDTAATDPRRLALNDPKDPLIGITCFGFLVELGTLSASNKTDYVLTRGFLIQAGGAAWEQLLRRCVRVGLIIPLGGRGHDRKWKLIDDAPELFHIRLKDEVAWERQQKSDTRNDRYRVAVFLRDGDSCRYCGVVVQPNDNRSARGRTIDHVRPGQTARSVDDLVVACRSCNGARGKDWQDEDARDGFAARWPLHPIPSPLIFIRSTVIELEDKGHTIPQGSVIAERAKNPTRETPTADQHPAPAGVAAATVGSAPECQHPAPAGVAAPESRTDRSATERSGTAGPGRVGSGSGLVGSGGSPPTRASPAHPPDPPARSTQPRRTRRGRRSRSGGTTQ
jgi:5-methylcytosine-specific restriction endonuclease McrA